MKWLIAATTVLLAVGFFACCLYFSGKAEFLVLERHRTVTVNGVLVRGEVLGRKGIAIVTRRDAGKEHSYQLFSVGDTDMTGDYWVSRRLQPMGRASFAILSSGSPLQQKRAGAFDEQRRRALFYRGQINHPDQLTNTGLSSLYRNSSIAASSTSLPGRVSGSGSVARGSSTIFSISRKLGDFVFT